MTEEDRKDLDALVEAHGIDGVYSNNPAYEMYLREVAVRQEREACAKIVEDFRLLRSTSHEEMTRDAEIAAVIRARGGK